MFEHLQLAPADPILGLTDAFNKESNPNKINLGVGVYKDEQNQTPTLLSVIEAEKRLLANNASKSYLAISGQAGYDAAVQTLLFGDTLKQQHQSRLRTVQSPGGTGALRIAADFIHLCAPDATIWVSNPTWANHLGIFSAANLNTTSYQYYDATNQSLNLQGMIDDLLQAKAGDVVLLHACCHNPSGIDPDEQQWQQILDVIQQKQLIPFFDFAYQGFAKGPEEDAFSIRLFLQHCDVMLVANSFSKNFGLYNERIGGLTVVAKDQQYADIALSHIKGIIRTNYSNPPAHGAQVVTTILQNAELTQQWLTELADMRARIHEMRNLLVSKLAERNLSKDFSFINQQNGMFSFSGLSPEQVERLREEDAIYMVKSGRINVAGINLSNIDKLCDAIAKVES